VEVGADLALFIQVPQQANTIKVDQATVRWVTDGEFGLTFQNQRPEEQERLRLWLATEHGVA
jgi:predicted lysophospholipase L1 biosynthesis ABC-type transport system permease subunit